MKKLFLSLLFVLSFSLNIFAQTPSNDEVWKMLKSRYDYEKVDFNISETKNEVLMNSLKSSKFVNSNLSISELNFQNVTEVYHKDGIKSLFIPFIKNSNYTLLISIKGNDYASILKLLIIKNDVDVKGNGIMTVTTPSESFTHSFKDGKNQSTGNIASKAKSCFRTCFDNAYDTICDGFVGCVAWYTNPGVAVMAAAYCELKC